MTWAKPEQQPDRIPVHSFYADSELCKSAPHQQLWIYTRNRRLLIEENSKKLIDELVDVYTMLVSYRALINSIHADIFKASQT